MSIYVCHRGMIKCKGKCCRTEYSVMKIAEVKTDIPMIVSYAVFAQVFKGTIIILRTVFFPF